MTFTAGGYRITLDPDHVSTTLDRELDRLDESDRVPAHLIEAAESAALTIAGTETLQEWRARNRPKSKVYPQEKRRQSPNIER